MNLLLDTHVVIWWVAGERLRAEAADAIADPDNLVHVSAASIWEISIKQALGKLSVDGDLDGVVADDFEPLDITAVHARLAGELADHHADPFDRMLIAQASIHDLAIVTRDPAFAAYDVAVMAA